MLAMPHVSEQVRVDVVNPCGQRGNRQDGAALVLSLVAADHNRGVANGPTTCRAAGTAGSGDRWQFTATRPPSHPGQASAMSTAPSYRRHTFHRSPWVTPWR